MATDKKEVKLKVMEAQQEEAYKGIVRIDAEAMREIGVRPGDIVEIEGGKKTVGIVDRAFPIDVGQAVIRMDGMLRRNAKTGIGENVSVRQIEVKEAKTITLAPAQEGIMVKADPEIFKVGLLGRAIVKGDIIALGGTKRRRRTMVESPFFGDVFKMMEEDFMGNLGFGSLKFTVVETQPKQAVIITEGTVVKINPKAMQVVEESKVPDVAYEDIGGLDDAVKKVREMVELPLKHPEIFERLGIQPPKGVLLHGPPGTGKTLLAKAVASESDAHFILLNGPECMSKFVGEAEEKIRKIFEDAEKNAPSIIFIDEIDAIASKREECYGEVERRVVAQLLATMDGMKGRGKVIVIGATNRPNALDPALRRPGRFDREIEIGIPDKKGRLEILKVHTRNMPLTKDVDLQYLADISYGFVGADLEALCKEAAMNVLRRIAPQIKGIKDDETIPEDVLQKLIVAMDDFREGLKLVSPSALREVLVEIPNVRWTDIGGLDDAKQQLKEAVEWPLKYPDAFIRLGIQPPKGMLLYGPPGCGKTLLAKAVAKESEANFILVKGPELLSKWVGESEKGVREIFKKARQSAPTIIFFDEIDSLTSRRGSDTGTDITERVVNQLLTEIDGLEELHDVVIIGATNRPDLIDTGLLRPGRFDRTILIPPPDRETREVIFKIHTKGMPLANDILLDRILDATESFNGADMTNLCKEAAIEALREDIDAKIVTMAHFDKALLRVRSSIVREDIQKYKEIEEDYIKKVRAGIPTTKPDYMG